MAAATAQGEASRGHRLSTYLNENSVDRVSLAVLGLQYNPSGASPQREYQLALLSYSPYTLHLPFLIAPLPGFSLLP